MLAAAKEWSSKNKGLIEKQIAKPKRTELIGLLHYQAWYAMLTTLDQSEAKGQYISAVKDMKTLGMQVKVCSEEKCKAREILN